MPNKNPEHAAVKSKATHFLESHPMACAMDGASPNISSGLDVAHMTISIWEAGMPLMRNACWAASMPNVRSVSGTTTTAVSASTVVVVVVVAVAAAVDVVVDEGWSKVVRDSIIAGRVPSWTNTRRSLIPVRVLIHSSLVSCTLSRSTLVSSVEGLAEPMPIGRTRILPPEAADNDVVVIAPPPTTIR
jgi:hypothetical protein